MTKTHVLERVRLRKPLPVFGGETLPAGIDITLTQDWDTIPPDQRGRIVIDPAGEHRLVREEDLEYALGAH